ncbi:glycosyltransferase family 39 protein [Saccharopolyspora gloriosae]|uniref:ArnT family glycosyltransferase n=1 Tax=Saccharopolyspora gloriosae TaxID=455344 RepID=UPI001FB80150|nr:glycosyltransferase family 39 protein [Saccharopolyspora gloriosae]
MSTALAERSAAPPVAAPTRSGVPELATGPLLLIATAVTAVLLLASGRYGYYADELYFLAAGHHLDWGYVDQPPLVPLIALLADTVFPGSLLALRLLPAVAAGAGVVVTALLARELGGDRRAQLLAGGAWAVAGQTLGGGHMLATVSFDPVLWTVVLWLLVRWVRMRDQGVRQDWPLFAAGACTALAMQVKLLIPVLWLVLGVVLLCAGPRSLLRTPLLWAGAAVALLTAAPTLWWQAAHGWPQLAMSEAIEQESSFGPLLIPSVVLCAGIPGGVLLCLGFWRLLRAPALRPYRFLAWTIIGVTGLVALTESRPYYLAGFYGLLFAVGAVEFRARWLSARVYGVSALVAVLATLPVLPVALIPRFDLVGTGSVGWPELTAIVERNAREHRAPVITRTTGWRARCATTATSRSTARAAGSGRSADRRRHPERDLRGIGPRVPPPPLRLRAPSGHSGHFAADALRGHPGVGGGGPEAPVGPAVARPVARRNEARPDLDHRATGRGRSPVRVI